MSAPTGLYCGVCGEPVEEGEQTVMTDDRGTLHALCYLADESARWPEPTPVTWIAALATVVLGLCILALAAFAMYLLAGAFA